jgi:hypothetical protein
MSGNPVRKMRRGRADQLKLIENMNRSGIGQLMKQHVEHAEKFNQLVMQVIFFQKEILAIKNALKKLGVITELDVSKERSAIEDMERMESQAVILGEKKNG